jgi:hypothetical protein
MFSRATARVAVDTAEDPNPRRGRTIGGKREVLSALQRRERERERPREWHACSRLFTCRAPSRL